MSSADPPADPPAVRRLNSKDGPDRRANGKAPLTNGKAPHREARVYDVDADEDEYIRRTNDLAITSNQGAGQYGPGKGKGKGKWRAPVEQPAHIVEDEDLYD